MVSLYVRILKRNFGVTISHKHRITDHLKNIFLTRFNEREKKKEFKKVFRLQTEF